MFMSNFTRCGGFAKFWQSVTNLSCCNIDSIPRHMKSMKTFVFTMLFMFMMVSVYGQNAGRSVFLDRCLADAPEPQFSQEDLEELYSDECSSDLSFTVTPEIQGDDCDWQVIYTYTITCPDLDEPIIFKTIYRGGDQTAPELTGTIPDDQANLNLCFDNIPEGPSIEEIGAQFEDTCGTVIVEKSGDPVGDDCSWSVIYTYTVRDACNNYYENEIKVEYSGGDTEAPTLSDKAEIPTGNLNSELCFDNKEQGPTEEEIAALFEDNCGNVNVTKVSESKGTDCKWLANYYYFVSDDCGNELEEPIVITYRGQDETPPVLMNIPEDVTVNCIDEVPEYPEKDPPYATDNCDDDVDVSFNEDASGLGIACEGGVVIRTWTAVDDCGVSSTQSQTITVLPAPKAEFEEFPAEVEITCEELGSYQPSTLGYSNGVEDGACAVNGEAEPQYTPIEENCGSFEVYYSFTDECGDLIEAVQVVNVVDNEAPQVNPECLIEDLMILTSEGYDCPADAMISLNVGDEIDAFTGWTVAGRQIPSFGECVSDNCAPLGDIVIRVVDKTASDDVCENRLTITFVAEDNCDNISEPFSCSYIVKDDTAPTFTAPEDAMVFTDNKCDYDASVEVTGDVIDEADNCNNQLEATYLDVINEGQCEGEVIITRTWSLSDSCGNKAEDQVQIITVKDARAPTFKKPGDITIYTDEECQYNASPDVTGFPTEVADNCSTELEPQYSDEVEEGECPGEYTITRTWTLMDDCGNESVPQVQIITVEDNIAPELTIPADETVQCDDIPAAGVATATDNCDPNVTVELISENEVDNDNDNCVATYKIFRIWLATDCAGNTTQKTQEITVIDSTKPMLQLPPDITVECDAVPVLDEGAATATDNCDPNPEVVFIDEKIEQGDDNCDAAYILFRSWRATDCSGNTVTGTQTIIVEDTTAPILTIPADVTVECDSVPPVGQVSAEDNCDPEVSISEVDEVRTDGDCPYNYILTRSWTATDDCGNSVTETQTITVQDTTAPTFVKPADIEIFTDEECEYNASVEITGYPTEIMDNCSSALEASYEDNILPGDCVGSYIIERTWSLVDECNNAAVPQVQIITVSDNIAPQFNLQCQFEDLMILTSDGYDCPADAMISLNVGDEIDINTGWTVAGATIPSLSDFCVGDNCTPAEELIIRVTDKTSSDDVCENRLTITFVAEDDCGNISEPFMCSYIVKDDTAPTFTAPEDAVIYSDNKCEYDASVEFTGDVVDEADNCNNQLEATYVDSDPVAGQCEGEVIITRTWSLADSCGNQAEDQVQIITVKDNIAPTFKKPDDIEIYTDEECEFNASPDVTGFPTEIADNCSTDLEPTYEDSILPGDCTGSYVIERTWNLMDDCGNESAPQVQVITVTDNMAPQVNEECLIEDLMILTSEGYDCPADAMISLNVGDEIDLFTGWTVAGRPIAEFGSCVYDNCSSAEEIILRVTDKTSSDDVCENRLTITFVAEDDCGNISEPFSCSYIVKDDTAPTFTAPEDTVIYSDNKCEYDASVEFTGDVIDEADNCNNQLEATYLDVINEGQCEGEVIITRTWSLSDSCGNKAADQVQTITVKDNIAPTFKKPDDIEIFKDEQCYADDSPANTGYPTEVADNCSTELEPTFTDEVSPICEGSYTITRTWNLMDDCGNESAPQVQIITVTDNLPPVYTPAQDETVECSPGGCTYYIQLFDSFNDGWQGDTVDVIVNGEVVLDDLTLADLFGGEEPIEGENDPIPFQVNTGDNIMTFFVVGAFAGEASWEVLDADQNMVATGDGDTPVDITADCGEDGLSSDEKFAAWLANNGGATAFDNCSEVVWTNNSQGLSDLCGNTGSETVTFTATDDCGNFITTTATFTIEDTTPPSIDKDAMDMTVECDGNGNVDALNAWLDSYGGAMASDVCGSISWSHDFEGLSDDCGATGSATVTFTVMDECENASTTTATFTIEDTTAPEFTYVPADRLDLECGVDEVPTDEALAGDECGMVDVSSIDYYTNTPWRAGVFGGNGEVDFAELPDGFTVTGSNTGTFNDGYLTVGMTIVKNVILTFDWSYSNDGDTAFFDPFVYYLNGDIVPILNSGTEGSDSFQIQLSAGDMFGLGIFNPTDDCCGPGIVEISNINFEISNECPVVECFIREFTAEDECGNKTYAQQTIVFNDTTAPELEVPADITVECDSVPPVCPDANGGGGQAEPAAWINEFHYDNQGADQGEFVEVAANFDASGYKVVLYNGSNGTVYETLVLASPTMVGGVYYFVVSDSVQNGSPDGIALTDASDSLIQFLSYEGAFMGVGGPADSVMSTDVGVSEVSNTPIGESLQLVGTGSAYGDFTWSGPMAETPGAANTGQTIEVGGGDNGVDPNLSCITYSDLCDEAPKATYDGEVRTDGDCPNNYTLTRTWTVTDNCGNSTTKSQVITVQDTTPPTFTAPADTEIYTDFECKFNASPDVTGDVEDEMDNCSEDLNATYLDVVEDGPCEGSKVITRTWSLVDECGNKAADQVQIITVTDNTPPTFTAPEDAVIDCTESTDPSNPNVGDVTDEADNCTMSLEATYNDVITEGNCAGNYIITRTWSLQDDCGNKAEDQVQVITVEDKEAPELKPEAVLPMGESNINACLADAPYGPTLEEIADLFVDNCSEVVVTRAEKILGDDCYWSIMYSYFIEDDCGNKVEAPIKVFYNGGDKNAPTIKEGADVSFLDDQSGFQCLSEAPNAPKVGDIEDIFEDDCGDEVIVVELDPIILGDDCGWSVTYSWDVSDDCGNYADTVSVTYSGADTMAPELTGTPPDSYQNGLEGCIDQSPVITDDMIRPLYTDNCAANEDLVIEIVRKEAGTDCNWIVTYDVFVSDACGNDAAMMKFNYQGGDHTGPVLVDNCQEPPMYLYTSNGADCPADASADVAPGDVIDLDALFSVAGIDLGAINGVFLPLCFDDCSSADLVYKVRSVDNGDSDGCERTISVYIEAMDECGNTSVDAMLCQFIVKDDTAPVLNPVADQDFGVVPEDELYYGLPAGLVDKTGYTDNCQDPGMTTSFNDDLSDDGGVFIPNPATDSSNGITFTCGGYDYKFLPTGGYYYGRPVYQFENTSFLLYYYGNGWVAYAGFSAWYTYNDDSQLPPCDVSSYYDNTNCGLTDASCEGQGGILKTTYTLVRTFSADDGCGNIGYTQVTYTWMVETVVNDNTSASQGQGSEFEFPCTPLDDTVDHGEVPSTDPQSQARAAIDIDFQAYPVPFDKEVTISYEFEFETEVTIEFFDTKGLLIAKRFNKNYVAGTKDQTYVDLSRYPNQMYYVKLTTNRGSVTKKIISSGK